MKIEFELVDCAGVWTVADADTYDGALDSAPENQIIGYGRTQLLALKDFVEQFEELEDGRYMQEVR